MRPVEPQRRAIAFLMAWLVFAPLCLVGQGTILFDTHVPGIVDSQWVQQDGVTPLGPDWGAELALLVGPGKFEQLLPLTTFKDGPASELGYVNPVVVTVPGMKAGESASVSMIVFRLSAPDIPLGSYGTQITLGGGDLPPAYLTGLPAEMTFIPEPTAFVLLALAGIGLFLRLFFKNSRAAVLKKPCTHPERANDQVPSPWPHWR